MKERFFVDHHTIHDRMTGRHVSTENAAKLLSLLVEYDQSTEEAEAELRADGVDVDAFISRVHADIGTIECTCPHQDAREPDHDPGCPAHDHEAAP